MTISLMMQCVWRKKTVQIIGWLYQYYNTEKKDAVFADLKNSIKISKENIPAATQLFTPDWIVRYMVENSIGRLWMEGHPNDSLKAQWRYYLDEAEQEPQVQAQLATVRKEYAAISPEQIKCIDPCAGSGHILAYLFDVLVQIYEDYGYSAREAVRSIVENNIYGLDIDERAAQLSYFSVMMKARQFKNVFVCRDYTTPAPDWSKSTIGSVLLATLWLPKTTIIETFDREAPVREGSTEEALEKVSSPIYRAELGLFVHKPNFCVFIGDSRTFLEEE